MALSISGCKDNSQYIANAGSVAAAWLAASLSESLVVNAYPLSGGVTSRWAGQIAIGAGGPASWIATGVYLVTRMAIMYGWKEYQLAQAAKIERACKKAERTERLLLLDQHLSQNSIRLQNIVKGLPQ